MVAYVYSPTSDYRSYLQNREYIARYEEIIDQNTSRLVEVISDASRQADSRHTSLHDQMTSLEKQLASGFEAVAETLSNMKATFEWGFSEVLVQLGKTNATLEELLKVAKTPSQTWAFEQYDIARNALKRGLHREALKYGTMAIEGDAHHSGYELDYRFHYLVGTIRLGSPLNINEELIDPSLAEKALLAAARYAEASMTHEKVNALMGAAWAAYLQGRRKAALDHARNAQFFASENHSVLYYLAKYMSGECTSWERYDYLRKLIRTDVAWLEKALGDRDFLNDPLWPLFLNGEVGQTKAALLKKLDDLQETINFVAGAMEGSDSLRCDTEVRRLLDQADHLIKEGSSGQLVPDLRKIDKANRLICEIKDMLPVRRSC
jgi:tetratricopeptide (TPR) repeat protein